MFFDLFPSPYRYFKFDKNLIHKTHYQPCDELMECIENDKSSQYYLIILSRNIFDIRHSMKKFRPVVSFVRKSKTKIGKTRFVNRRVLGSIDLYYKWKTFGLPYLELNYSDWNRNPQIAIHQIGSYVDEPLAKVVMRTRNFRAGKNGQGAGCRLDYAEQIRQYCKNLDENFDFSSLLDR